MLLPYRITIERRTETRQPNGSLAIVSATLAECFAAVRPISGRERAAAGQVEGSADYRFTIRRNGAVDVADVIVYEGREYNITFVNDAGSRDLYTTLDAVRGVAI